jgi:membrane associated rhomboid family serine protease
VAANAAVYLAMVLSGVGPLEPGARQLFAWGGNAGIVTLGEGQYWRLFTSMFVHAGLLHIGMNMAVLWSIGRFIERVLGPWQMILIYLAAGMIGSVASALLHPRVVSIGASGAIFGLYGALLGFLVRHRERINPAALRGLRNSALAFIGYNLVFSAAIPGIDLSAHLGGLIGGFLAGLLAKLPRRPPPAAAGGRP